MILQPQGPSEKFLKNDVEAYRRISAMNLLKELAKRITLSLSSAPEIAKRDRVNAISENRVEMKFTASLEILQKVERLKEWLAHKHPDLSLGELFEKLCDLGLSEWNPTKTAAPRKRRVKTLAAHAIKGPQSMPLAFPRWRII